MKKSEEKIKEEIFEPAEIEEEEEEEMEDFGDLEEPEFEIPDQHKSGSLEDDIPDDFVDDINENQNLVNKDEELGLNNFTFDEEDEDELPHWLEELEQGPGDQAKKGMSAEEIKGFSNLVVDLSQVIKDNLDTLYTSGFLAALKNEIPESRRLHRIVVQAADQEGKLTTKGISETLTNLKKHDPEFKEISFVEVMDTANTFREIKRKYSTAKLKTYQKEGIRKYTSLVIKKHFVSSSPDPAFMLGTYMLIVFGGDAMKAYSMYRKKRIA